MGTQNNKTRRRVRRKDSLAVGAIVHRRGSPRGGLELGNIIILRTRWECTALVIVVPSRLRSPLYQKLANMVKVSHSTTGLRGCFPTAAKAYRYRVYSVLPSRELFGPKSKGALFWPCCKSEYSSITYFFRDLQASYLEVQSITAPTRCHKSPSTQTLRRILAYRLRLPSPWLDGTSLIDCIGHVGWDGKKREKLS